MIYDTNGDALPSYLANLESGSSSVGTIRIMCRDGMTLTMESVPDITVEARLVGDVSWINIVSSPIDLSPYNGMTKDFQLRITAGVVTEDTFVVANIEA